MDKFFKISERGSNVKTEIMAGLTTFFAMAYIVVTNPNQVVGFNFGGEMDTIDYEAARGYKGVKEATLNINGLEVKVAIVNGIKNAKAVMDDVRAGKSPYHFIEVMACPGGCLNGGGAPFLKNPAKVAERMNKMYESDAKNPVRRSHENKEVEMLYQDFLKEPCGHVSHHLLHTHYVDRSGEVK